MRGASGLERGQRSARPLALVTRGSYMMERVRQDTSSVGNIATASPMTDPLSV